MLQKCVIKSLAYSPALRMQSFPFPPEFLPCLIFVVTKSNIFSFPYFCPTYLLSSHPSSSRPMLSLTSRRQRCLFSVWFPLPFNTLHSRYHISSSNKRHLLLAIFPPLLCICLCLSLLPGISFLSAFYSKSNHKAFIEPELRESGYIWPAYMQRNAFSLEARKSKTVQTGGMRLSPDLTLID